MRGMGKGTYRRLSRQIAAYEDAGESAAAELNSSTVDRCTERRPCGNCQACSPRPMPCDGPCGTWPCKCPGAVVLS